MILAPHAAHVFTNSMTRILLASGFSHQHGNGVQVVTEVAFIDTFDSPWSAKYRKQHEADDETKQDAVNGYQAYWPNRQHLHAGRLRNTGLAIAYRNRRSTGGHKPGKIFLILGYHGRFDQLGGKSTIRFASESVIRQQRSAVNDDDLRASPVIFRNFRSDDQLASLERRRRHGCCC